MSKRRTPSAPLRQPQAAVNDAVREMHWKFVPATIITIDTVQLRSR